MRNENALQIFDSIILGKETQSKLAKANELLRHVDPATNLLHAYFSTLAAATGRGSTSPNVQNLPKTAEFRSLIIAPLGYLLMCFDFAQIEIRVLAHYLYPSAFSDFFFQPGDFYLHMKQTLFAAHPHLDRERVKLLVLAVVYGKSPYTLATDLGVTAAEASQLQTDFFRIIPDFDKLKKKLLAESRDGWVSGLLNRPRYLPGLLSKNPYEYTRAVDRLLINSVVQGGAQTVFKYKMNELRRRMPTTAKYLLNCHDEALYAVPENDAQDLFVLAKEILEAPIPWFSIPLKVEGGLGRDWFTAKTNKINPASASTASKGR